ncbi:MAG: hypothetical protein RL204_1940 [Bacteroidota bacterium]|jgi:gliding motility-associated-like protein
MSFREKLFLILTALIIVPSFAVGQCIVINEILINGPGGCDGACSPSTEEWVELYNTCNSAVDLSCYVMTDGDFTVTFPAGTTIPSFGYVTIGSSNSGFTPTINLASCGCTAGGGLGVFGNGAEQVVLLDNTGALLDAVVWGGGQFPMNLTSSMPGCPNLNANFPNANTNFETLPGGGGQGESIARGCDGSATWEIRPVTEISPNSSNGEPAQVDFDSSESVICPGQCIDFTDLTVGDPNSWTWSFPGSSTSSANVQNPVSICYPTSGLYDVELVVTNSCGTYTLNVPDFIEVSGTLTPSISANDPIEFCAGSSTTLSTAQTGNLQWYWNGNPLANGTSNSITVSQTGTYNLTVDDNGCTGTSNSINVVEHALPTGSISTASPLIICPGSSSLITLAGTFNSSVWWQDATITSNNTNQFTVTQSGVYTAVVSNTFGCEVTTNAITFQTITYPTPVIISSEGNSICPTQNTILSVDGGYTNYSWFDSGTSIGTNSNTTTINQPGVFDVEITTAENCVLQATITIAESTISPSITTLDPIQFCEGETANLNTIDSGNIQWLENGNPIVGENNASIILGTTGDYSIEVNENGCIGISNVISLESIAYPTGTITANAPLVLCPGQSIDITLAGVFDSFEWRKDGGPLANNNTTISVTEAGSYSAILYNEIGCSVSTNTIEIEIILYPATSITSSEGNSICPNEITTLTATGGFVNYEWYFNGGILNLNTPNIDVTNVGDYEVEITTVDNCILSNSITIAQAPIPTPSIVPNNLVQSCEETVTLTASGAQSFQWFMDGGELIGENSNSLIVTENGEYFVEATNVEGCSALSQPTTVEFLPPLQIEIIASNTTPCEGESVSLFIAQNFVSYNWSTEETSSAISISNNQVYSVEVTDAIGCTGYDEITVDFIALPEINAGEDVLSNCVAGALLEATGEGNLSWEENDILYDGSSPIVLVNPERTATFTAVAELNGCINTDEVTVIVDCNSLFIPNAFSPNEDGINDIFQVRGTGIYEFDLKIFDRWGNLIFQTNDPSDVWTGGIDGYYVPDGVYTYQVKALNIDGNPINGDSLVYGSILVIR